MSMYCNSGWNWQLSDWTVKQDLLNDLIETGVGGGFLPDPLTHLTMCCRIVAPFFERRLVEPRRIELLTS